VDGARVNGFLPLPSRRAGASLWAMADSYLDPTRVRQARAMLLPPPTAEGVGGVAAAAIFFVLSALGLAMTVVLMPTPWPH
jgi:hypothetical protein